MTGLGVKSHHGANQNGIQLGSNGLLYQLVTQYLTWFRHEGILLGAPLLDPGFDPIGTPEIDEQLFQWHPTFGGTEPPQGIDKADPFDVYLLMSGRLQHDEPDEIVDQGEDRQFFKYSKDRFTV